jgi:hypothetical protein
MLIFPNFVVLQNQKTGSTFLEAFFRRFSTFPPAKGTIKHQPPNLTYDRSKVYLVSVRHPVSTYLSLFNYGLTTGDGTVRNRQDTGRQDELYRPDIGSFAQWTELLLDTSGREAFGDEQFRQHADRFGYVSYRYLRLAVPFVGFKLKACKTPADVLWLHRNQSIVKWVLRNESLREDLRVLVEGPLRPFIKDVPAALAYLESAPPVNASEPVITVDDLPAGLAVRIMEREWVLRDLFYPNEDPNVALARPRPEACGEWPAPD